jgi:hypothetical protein
MVSAKTVRLFSYINRLDFEKDEKHNLIAITGGNSANDTVGYKERFAYGYN